MLFLNSKLKIYQPQTKQCRLILKKFDKVIYFQCIFFHSYTLNAELCIKFLKFTIGIAQKLQYIRIQCSDIIKNSSNRLSWHCLLSSQNFECMISSVLWRVSRYLVLSIISNDIFIIVGSLAF